MTICVDSVPVPTCNVCWQQYSLSGEHKCPAKVFAPEVYKPLITTTNPKDLMGDRKVSLDAVSPFANIEESLAMMDGEMKYGYRNWRDKAVRARVYINACKRHLDMWLEGQERASDSKVHHLGHARACLGIILDAQATGQLVDDRSKTGDLLEHKMEKASKWVAWRKQFLKVTAMQKSGHMMQDSAEYHGAVVELENLEAELTLLGE
jgi:hypothetical protein